MRMSRAEKKANDTLQREMVKQVNIVYSAAAIAMWLHYGWRQQRILGVLEETGKIWNTCAMDPNTSILMMLEAETGIEIRARGVEKSYHELDFLNGTPADAHPMELAEFVYMRKRQIPWVNPQITGALLLALHRKYGWSGERDKRLLGYKDGIEEQYKWKANRLVKACNEMTGINIVQEMNRRE